MGLNRLEIRKLGQGLRPPAPSEFLSLGALFKRWGGFSNGIVKLGVIQVDAADSRGKEEELDISVHCNVRRGCGAKALRCVGSGATRAEAGPRGAELRGILDAQTGQRDALSRVRLPSSFCSVLCGVLHWTPGH